MEENDNVINDIGQFKEVLKKYIKPNTWNPNIMTDEDKTKLKKSVDRNGMLQTVLLYERSENDYMIVDGEHRWHLADDDTPIRAIVINDTDLASIKSNIETKEGIKIKQTDDVLKHLTVIMNKLRGNATPMKISELLETLSVEETQKASLMLMDETEIQFYSLVEEIEDEKRLIHEKEFNQEKAEFIKFKVRDVTGLKSVIVNVKDKEFKIDGELKELESMTMTVNKNLQPTLNCRYKDIITEDEDTPPEPEDGTPEKGSEETPSTE